MGDAPSCSEERTDAGAQNRAHSVDEAPEEEGEEGVCAAEHSVDEIPAVRSLMSWPWQQRAYSRNTYLSGVSLINEEHDYAQCDKPAEVVGDLDARY